MPENTSEKLSIEEPLGDPLNFFVPLEKTFFDLANTNLEKARLGESIDPKSWKIGGYASSSDEDLEGESIDPNGIDLSYVLKNGLFNSDHQKGPEHVVGVIEDAYVDSKGLYVKGYLLQGVKEAEAIYRLMRALSIGKHDRKMGFSIEGKVLEQVAGRITKCWIKCVSLTMSPVNTKTYAELIKSLKEKYGPDVEVSVEPSPDLVKKAEDAVPLDEIRQHAGVDKKHFEKIITLAEEIKTEASQLLSEDKEEFGKALSAGHNTGNGGPAGQQTGGDALRTQDLDNKLKVTTNVENEDPEIVNYTIKKSGIDDIDVVRKIIRYATLLKERS